MGCQRWGASQSAASPGMQPSYPPAGADGPWASLRDWEVLGGRTVSRPEHCYAILPELGPRAGRRPGGEPQPGPKVQPLTTTTEVGQAP